MSVKEDESATNKWHFTFDESTPSVAVIEAIAFVTNRDPTDVEPLADVIDPDVLDRLPSRDDTVQLSFTWEEQKVQISAAGEIIVTRAEPAP